MNELFDCYESTEERKVIDANYMSAKGLLGGKEWSAQKKYLTGALDAAIAVEPDHVIGELLVIKVPGTRCVFKLPYLAPELAKVRRHANGIRTKSHLPVSRPDKKPVGKSPEVITQEAEAEVARFYDARESAKREYLYCMGEGQVEAERKYAHWCDTIDRIDRKEITLKSLAGEFNGHVPSWHEVSVCRYDAQSWIDTLKRRATISKKSILQGYPSLAKELGFDREVERKEAE